MGVYWATFATLLGYLVLDWFIGIWMHLTGSDLWILRGGLALLGFIGAIVFLQLYFRAKANQWAYGKPPREAQPLLRPAEPVDDLVLLAREAVQRLKSSRLGRSASLVSLPLVFLVGESGSTKTSTIINSALDPELLAGHVYQDNSVIPTRGVNFWYTQQAIFVDPAGSLLSEPAKWARLIKLSQPGRFSSALKSSQQAPRAAIVCYNIERFLIPGASESSVANARTIAARLQEISQILGINFPVYVLFTRIDRIPFFAEYAHNLTKEEASQVFGATLPVRPTQSVGVYAEEETRRLSKAFDELFYSLAEKRTELLSRASEPDKLPGIYEFPRELRKLRGLLVQFLVDLGRLSQLRANPFLRGFYFSGVRAVVVDDVSPAASERPLEPPVDAGATRIFSGPGSRNPAVAPVRAVGSRRMPQWIFVSQVFNDIILKDRVALRASGFSTQVSLLRRVALIATFCICLLLALCFSISFIGNRALENEVTTAALELRGIQPAPGQVPGLTDLQKLDRMRQALATISGYGANGVPLRLRWGMYVGDQIYQDARALYFQRFNQMLFGETQAKLLNALRSLPNKPEPNGYEPAYNALKAYLITTSNPERSTKEFLSPELFKHWQMRKNINRDEINELARRQFDFYSTELVIHNPFSLRGDLSAIVLARTYLSQFAGIDLYYLPLLADASRKSPDVSFNDQFKDSTGVVLSRHVVRGAFTRGGYSFMQEALRHPSQLTGERWVLGDVATAQLDATTLQQKLADRYYGDFINEWRSVLQTSAVVPYRDLTDASQKLERLSGQTSPLLELFWFVSHNTDVGVAALTDPFQPVQAVAPPGPPDRLPDQYISGAAQNYTLALAKLRADLDVLRTSPTGQLDTSISNQALNSVGAAKVAVSQTMSARVDQKYHTENLVRELLEQPITNAEVVIGRGPKEALNSAGHAFCQQFDQMTRKFPFNTYSSEDLPINLLNSVLAPKTGALWQFYDRTLAQFLIKQDSRYEANTSGTVKISPEFVAFFSRAAAWSDALYTQGLAPPRFSFSLKELPSNVEGLVLRIGSDTLSGMGQQKTFFWTGNNEDVQVTTKGGDTLQSYLGPWAVFRFVADAHSQVTGPVTNLVWILQNNGRPIMLPNGKQKSYSYQLQVSSSWNPFRQSGLFMRCVPQVAR